MQRRGMSRVGPSFLATLLLSGCAGVCEDDGLFQDEPSHCAAVENGSSGEAAETSGSGPHPAVPIDTEGSAGGGGEVSTAGESTGPIPAVATEANPEPSCDNGLLDDGETDVDCGGPCPTPCMDDEGCSMPGDCDSGVCEDGICIPASCEDGVHNAAETDKDCGGPDCDPCHDGKTCETADDCVSTVCEDEVCVPATCEDGVHNAAETDKDCGGPDCDPCHDGKTCEKDEDCVSGLCASGTCKALPKSCAEILADHPAATDGMYTLDPDGPGPILPFETHCDMTTDGGGWTAITPCIAEALHGTLFAVVPADIAGLDASCRPYTQDVGAQNHTYHYTFTFPPTFSEFYLYQYKAQAFGAGPGHTADIGWFVQTLWDVGYQGARGDISFGSADVDGPITSYAAKGAEVDSVDDLLPWPGGTWRYAFETTDRFRIGWGEQGHQSEGWIPWASGVIYLR